MTLSRRSLFRFGALAGGAAIAGAATRSAASASPLLGSVTGHEGLAGSTAAVNRMLDHLKPLSSDGLLPRSAGRLPGGSQLLSLSFPNSAKPGEEPNAETMEQKATVRYTRANGAQEELTVQPSSHRRDGFSGPVGSDPIALPEDVVALEFLGSEQHGKLRGEEPTAHVRTVGKPTSSLFGSLATDPYSGDGEDEGLSSTEIAQGSSALLQGSSEIAGALNEVLGDIAGEGSPLSPLLGADPLAELNIISRSEWDANESWRTWDAQFHPAQTITIHHSAMATGADYPANIRAIYRYHATTQNGGQGWGDIGYHLLIDPDGRIYQGRSTGVAGRAVFSSTSALPNCVTAGHVGNANNGNIGICLIGDFRNQAPTRAAIDATTRAVRVLAREMGVDPRTNVNYTNGSRSAQKPAVSGHRDWADFAGATTCPGDRAYGYLPEIRNNA